jgi:hypothetical protein
VEQPPVRGGGGESTNSSFLLPPHPYFLLEFPQAILSASHIYLPHIELIPAPVTATSVKVKLPAMLGTRDTGAEYDTKVFNIV